MLKTNNNEHNIIKERIKHRENYSFHKSNNYNRIEQDIT